MTTTTGASTLPHFVGEVIIQVVQPSKIASIFLERDHDYLHQSVHSAAPCVSITAQSLHNHCTITAQLDL